MGANGGCVDQRTAVQISVTLSGQLWTAAMAMLAIEGAYYSFAHVNRSVSTWFDSLALLALISFVYSMIQVGRGATKSRDDGYKAEWNLRIGKPHFNRQAISCYVGLCFFTAMVLASLEPKENKIEERLAELERRIISLETRFNERQDVMKGPRPAPQVVETSDDKVPFHGAGYHLLLPSEE